MRRTFLLLLLLAVGGLAPRLVAAEQSRPSVEQARSHYEAGARLFSSGDFHGAVAEFLEAERLLPSPSAEVVYNIGLTYDRMAEWDQAIRYYERYLSLAGDEARRADIEQRIAQLRAEQERVAQAIRRPGPSTGEINAEARTFFDRGVRFYDRRQYQQAYDAFQAAYTFAPLPELLFNMAMAAERLGRNQQAAGLYTRYLREAPDVPNREALRRHAQSLAGEQEQEDR